MASTRGRQVVLPLTNKSGGAVANGDIVILDASNDTAFTTTTSGRYEGAVGIAQEAIASNATGRVLIGGFASLVNVPSSVTRGHYIETHTVAKQATGSSTRRSGSFGVFLTGGTTPTAMLGGLPDQTASGGGGGITQAFVGYNTIGASWEQMTTYRVLAKKVTLAADCLMTNIEAYVRNSASGSDDIVQALSFAIYSDSAGTPQYLIGSGRDGSNGTPTILFDSASGSTGDDTGRWYGIALGKWLAAGDYWITVQMCHSSTPNMAIAYDGSGSDRYYTSGGDWLSDWGFYTPTTSSNKYSIRANTIK